MVVNIRPLKDLVGFTLKKINTTNYLQCLVMTQDQEQQFLVTMDLTLLKQPTLLAGYFIIQQQTDINYGSDY